MPRTWDGDRAVRLCLTVAGLPMLTMASRTVDAEVVAMRALVVYESMYGNTKEIATAIADGLSTRMPVQLTEVGAAPTVIADDIALLVVGAPTHGHGMSKDASRNRLRSAPASTSRRSSPEMSGCVSGSRTSRRHRPKCTSQQLSSTRGSR